MVKINFFVSKEPMQNFKILQYTLLGEKEHKEKKGRKKKERKTVLTKRLPSVAQTNYKQTKILGTLSSP